MKNQQIGAQSGLKQRVKGHYLSSGGPNGLDHEIPYYDIRFNHNKAHMSNTALGLQVLIDYIGSLMWINIRESWLIKTSTAQAHPQGCLK